MEFAAWICLREGRDLQRSLPARTILWFWNIRDCKGSRWSKPSVLVLQQLKWNKAGPGWTRGHGVERGRHKPVLSTSWAKRGGGRVWLGSGTSISSSLQLSPVSPGVLSAASSLFEFLNHKVGLISSPWTLQSFFRSWSCISAAGKLFPNWWQSESLWRH